MFFAFGGDNIPSGHGDTTVLIVDRHPEVCAACVAQKDGIRSAVPKHIDAAREPDGIRARPTAEPGGVVARGVVAQPGFIATLAAGVAVALKGIRAITGFAVGGVFLAVGQGACVVEGGGGAAEVVGELVGASGGGVVGMGGTAAHQRDPLLVGHDMGVVVAAAGPAVMFEAAEIASDLDETAPAPDQLDHPLTGGVVEVVGVYRRCGIAESLGGEGGQVVGMVPGEVPGQRLADEVAIVVVSVVVGGGVDRHQLEPVGAGLDPEVAGVAAGELRRVRPVSELQQVADLVVVIGLGVPLGLGGVGAARDVDPGVTPGGGSLFASGGRSEPIDRVVDEDPVEGVEGRRGAAAGGAVVDGEDVADQVVVVSEVLEDCTIRP